MCRKYLCWRNRKTPLALKYLKLLNHNGKNPAFIKKGYDYLYDEIQMLKKLEKLFQIKIEKKLLNH